MKRMLSLATAGLLVGVVAHATAQTLRAGDAQRILREDWRVAFLQAEGPRNSTLRSVKLDGTGVIDFWGTRVPLSNERYGGVDYAMTPDGQTLVYSALDGTYVQVRGRARTKIMTTLIGGIVVSPSGRQLAYTRKTGTNETDIYVCNIDGTGERQLTNARGAEAWPAWSPDGRRILFSQGADVSLIQRLMVMEADGSGQRALTRGSATAPEEIKFNMGKWSPDGTKIVAVGYTAGRWQIYTLNADGSSPRQLTTESLFHTTPSWSANGSQILFAKQMGASSTSKFDIFIMEADGTRVTNLTNTPEISETSPKSLAPAPPLRIRL